MMCLSRRRLCHARSKPYLDIEVLSAVQSTMSLSAFAEVSATDNHRQVTDGVARKERLELIPWVGEKSWSRDDGIRRGRELIRGQ